MRISIAEHNVTKHQINGIVINVLFFHWRNFWNAPSSLSWRRRMSQSAVPNLFLLAYPQAEKRKLAYPLVSWEKVFYDIFIVQILNLWESGIPLKIFHVPLVVRVPQVGNRWSKSFRDWKESWFFFDENVNEWNDEKKVWKVAMSVCSNLFHIMDRLMRVPLSVFCMRYCNALRFWSNNIVFWMEPMKVYYINPMHA